MCPEPTRHALSQDAPAPCVLILAETERLYLSANMATFRRKLVQPNMFRKATMPAAGTVASLPQWYAI
jgi:hypothetical protein